MVEDVTAIAYLHLFMLIIYHVSGVTGSPPQAPQAVSVTSVGANFLVQWRPPTESYGHISHYQVVYNVLPDAHDVIMTTNEQTFVLIPVADHPGRLYRITVLAENSEGLSVPSRSRYIRSSYGCGGNLHVSPERSVTVTSPFYPAKIEPNSICSWDISTNYTFVLSFSIDDIDFGEESCTNNYIILNGTNEHHEQMCNASSRHIISTGSWTRLSLHTGSDVTGRGLKVTVHSIVPIPGQPSNMKVVAVNNVINVTWEPPIDYNTDHITAYRVRYSVITSSNTVVITLPAARQSFIISTKGHEGQLFVVKVSVMHEFEEGPTSSPFYVRATCSKKIMLGPNIRLDITSPGYPGHYSPLVLCKWRITSGSGRPFYFRMTEMDVSESLFCNSDYVSLSIHDNNRRCGLISTPEHFTRVSGELNVTFVTDDQHQAKGFIMEIKSDKEAIPPQSPVLSTILSKIQNVSSPYMITSSVNISKEMDLSEQYSSSSSSYISTTLPLERFTSSPPTTTTTDTESSPSSSSYITSDASELSSEISLVPVKSSSTSSIIDQFPSGLTSANGSHLSSPITSITTGMTSVGSNNSSATADISNIVSNTSITSKEVFSHEKGLTSLQPQSTILTTDTKTSEIYSDSSTPSSLQDMKSHSFLETLTTLQPTSSSVCNATLNNSNFNSTYDIGIQMFLRSRGNSTEHLNSTKHLESCVVDKLSSMFNNTLLFTSITVSKLGELNAGKNSITVNVVVSFILCGLVSANICKPSLILVKYINETSLNLLTSHPAITERWEVESAYLQGVSLDDFVEKHDHKDICTQHLRDTCGSYKQCEENQPILVESLGQPNYTKTSSLTSIVVAVVGICVVLSASCVTILRLRRFRQHRKRIHVMPIQVQDILQDKEAERVNINFEMFSYISSHKSPFLRSGSLPSKTTLQRSQIEGGLKCDVNKLALFIEDTIALEKRLRMKRNVRRGNSF